MTTVLAERASAPASAPLRPPNRQALQITGRNYVSYSQLNLMRSCPKKFSFQYIEKAPKDFLPTSLVYGGSIHASLQHYYCDRLEGLTLSADETILAYHNAWRENLLQAGNSVPVKFCAKEDEAAVHAPAQRTIAAFLASP